MTTNISENSDMLFFTSYKKITSDEIIGKNALIWLILYTSVSNKYNGLSVPTKIFPEFRRFQLNSNLIGWSNILPPCSMLHLFFYMANSIY